jgi:hypothetical protein
VSDDLPASDGYEIACHNRAAEGPDGFDDLDLLPTVTNLARECITDSAKHLGSIVLGRGAYRRVDWHPAILNRAPTLDQ